MKKHWSKIYFAVCVVSALALLGIAFGGCGHVTTGRYYIDGCEEPESRAARHGTVL